MDQHLQFTMIKAGLFMLVSFGNKNKAHFLIVSAEEHKQLVFNLDTCTYGH